MKRCITNGRGIATLIAISLLVAALTGCENAGPEPDQTVRNRIFMECLKALPKGPESTKYNDWGDVVDSCEHAAYYQSLQIGPSPIKGAP